MTETATTSTAGGSIAVTTTTTTQVQRRKPNILVTGTPGTGKTATAAALAETIDFLDHVNVGEMVQQHRCYDGRDEELDTNVLDEDKLLDLMETIIDEIEDGGQERGIVADFHVPEIFPERWFDLVLVLRCQTEILYDRLLERGYKERKLQENMESEIMQVILEEAKEAYDPAIVHEVPSNTLQDMENTIQRVRDWCKQWIADQHGNNDSEELEEENEES